MSGKFCGYVFKKLLEKIKNVKKRVFYLKKFYVGPPKKSIFRPPAMFYISVINTQVLQIAFLHDKDLLWAAFSCIASTPVFLTCGYSFMVAVLLCFFIVNGQNHAPSGI